MAEAASRSDRAGNHRGRKPLLQKKQPAPVHRVSTGWSPVHEPMARAICATAFSLSK